MANLSSSIHRKFLHPIYRTLRVDILTLFLSLFIISFAFVIAVTHIEQKKGMEELSLSTVQRASDIVQDKIQSLVYNTTRFANIFEYMAWHPEEISVDNDNLILYMQEVVKLEKEIANIFMASTQGKYIGVNDLTLSSQRTFITHPLQALPKEAIISVFYIDDTVKPPKNIWLYRNAEYNTICSEEDDEFKYDPRERPWYQGAVKANGIYWSDIFTHFATGDRGISVSEPIHDRAGNIIGVAGVNITLRLIAEFLSKQEIGKSGEVFLLNNDGEDIVKPEKKSHQGSITYQTVSDVYNQYQKTKETSFIIDSTGVKYLAHVNTVPLVPGENWLIMIVVPYEDFFGQVLRTEQRAIFIAFVILILSTLLVIYFAKRISSPIVTLSKEIDKMKHLELSSETRVKSNIREIMLMDSSIASMRFALRSFATYVPRRIVQKLLDKGEEIALGGEKKNITVLFSDIAGFTSIAEAITTEEVMSYLTEYFDNLSKIIIKNEGVIDKYMGDGIMAFWGAPLEIPDHSYKACKAALHCQAFLSKYNDKRKAEGKPELFTRIAINTGTVIIGNIGTSERMNYTAIGDAVNTTAHLQQVNKIYHTKIIITEETYKQAMGMFLVRPLDVFLVRGKKARIKIYELVAINQGDQEILAKPEEIELCALFAKGFEAFNAKNLKEAQEIFQQIHQKFPDDFPTQIYLDRIKGNNTLTEA